MTGTPTLKLYFQLGFKGHNQYLKLPLHFSLSTVIAQVITQIDCFVSIK